MPTRLRRAAPLLAVLVASSGCAAAHSNVRLARGVDLDLFEDDDDDGDLGEVGEEGDEGPAPAHVEPTAVAPEPAPTEPAPTELAPTESAASATDVWGATPTPSEPVALASGSTLAGRALTREGRQAVAGFSPDGSQIIFQAVRAGGLVDNPWQQTWLMDADGSRQRRITMGVGRTERPSFVPGRPGVVSYASTHHTGATPEPAPGAAALLAADLDIYVQDLARGTFTALTASPGYDGGAAWCGDGSRVAFSSARDGDIELYTMAADGSDVRRLTRRPGADASPAWSPDCTKLAWSAHREGGGRASLVVANADGSDASVVVAGEAVHETPTWLPSGAALVFASTLASSDGTSDLFRVDLADGALRRLTDSSADERDPVLSPDGAKLLYTSNDGAGAQLHVAPLDPAAGVPWTTAP